jgi:hypothetical protein
MGQVDFETKLVRLGVWQGRQKERTQKSISVHLCSLFGKRNKKKQKKRPDDVNPFIIF